MQLWKTVGMHLQKEKRVLTTFEHHREENVLESTYLLVPQVKLHRVTELTQEQCYCAGAGPAQGQHGHRAKGYGHRSHATKQLRRENSKAKLQLSVECLLGITASK